jgi:hypothetical protein
MRPVSIRVRIGPQHPFASRKRRLNWVVIRMRPEKPRPRVTTAYCLARFIEIPLPSQRP